MTYPFKTTVILINLDQDLYPFKTTVILINLDHDLYKLMQNIRQFTYWSRFQFSKV